MKRISAVFTIISILMMPFAGVHASDVVDAFLNGKKIEVNYHEYFLKDCTECSNSKEKAPYCPSYYDYMIDQTVKGSIYSGVTGKKIVDSCLPPNVPMPSNMGVMTNRLKAIYKAPKVINPKNLDVCFSQNKLSDDAKSSAHKKVLLSYMYGLDESIKELQKNKIKELALADQLLNQKVLSDIHCSDHENHCGELKKCPSQSKAFDETVDYSMASLKELAELNKQLAISHQINLNPNITPPSASEMKNIRDDITEKINFIKQMNPWFEGDILKKGLSSVMSNINANKMDMAKELFKKSFTAQIKNAREIEKKELIELNLAQDCLVDNYSCDSKTLKKLNSYYIVKQSSVYNDKSLSAPEARELNTVINAGSCMARLKKDKENLDETNLMMGRILGGFVIGGAGGIIRLGSLAAKFYQAGSRLKGIASASVLAAEGAMAVNTFKTLGNTCTQAVNHMNTSNENQLKMCSDEAKGIFKVAKLKPCITGIALTTLPGLLALKGFRGIGSTKDIKNPLIANLKIINKADDIALKLDSKVLSAAEKKTIGEQIERMNLKDHELLDVVAKINSTVKTTADKQKVASYINFVGSLKPQEKMAALREIGTASFKSGTTKGSYTNAFLSKEGKFDRYEKYHQILIEKNLIRKGVSPANAKTQSATIARESRDKMHKKIYACQSKTVTPEHKAAAAKFVGLSTAIGVAGTGFGNYRANSDKFEANKADWFAKLGYDIAMSVLISKITGKIMTTAGDGPVKRYFKSNAAYASVGSLDGIVYSNIYGVSKDEAQKKLERIKNSPELSKELKILEKYIDQNDLAKKFEDQIVGDYKKVLSSAEKTKIMGNPPYIIGYETFNSLTAKDLDNPVIRDKLVQGIIIEMNKGIDNPIVSTGDLGADRWVNDRVWSAAIGVPKGIVMSTIMFQILCVGSDKPFTSLGLATGVQVTNQFLNGDAYYKFRRTMIGQ